jgi:hypothetical protein
MSYDARNWYWIVGGDETRAYSSAIGDYVPAADATFNAWKAGGNTPTRIASVDELAEVLATASVRPTHADMLDRFKGSQASKLTLELVAKILFNHGNRLRALEGKPSITPPQFAAALKAML